MKIPRHLAGLVAYEPGRSAASVTEELGIEDVVKLASNERSSSASPRAIEAATRAILDAHIYPDGDYGELRTALATRFGRSPEEIVVGNGSNELIELAFRTFATQEHHVVFADPSFAIYRVVSEACGVPFTAVPMRPGFQYDIDAILAAVRPETRLVLIATPNNPTGTYVPRRDLERLLRGLPAHVVPVIDEAYVEFCDADDFVDALAIGALHPHTLVLRTFSKAYGLAALRIGYGIGSRDAIAWMQRVRPPFNVNTPAARAAQAALLDEAHLAAYVAENRRERARVHDALAALGLDPVPTQANFVLVGVDAEGREVFDRLLREGVIVRPLGGVLSRYLRITIGRPEENDRMLDGLARVLTS